MTINYKSKSLIDIDNFWWTRNNLNKPKSTSDHELSYSDITDYPLCGYE